MEQQIIHRSLAGSGPFYPELYPQKPESIFGSLTSAFSILPPIEDVAETSICVSCLHGPEGKEDCAYYINPAGKFLDIASGRFRKVKKCPRFSF